MQVIIPMSGVGQRFIDAGYKDIKPLIKADGKPMIQYIVELFPSSTEIIFVCNKNHLKTTSLRKTLRQIAPQAKIVGIPWHKKGPVYAVMQVHDLIRDEGEVIVQYVDTYKYWDYKDFIKETRKRKADAAITANIGFHPHMLTGINYALSSADKGWMKTMVEKKPLEDMGKEYVSDGTYYFSSGALMKKYFSQLVNSGESLKGEYYVTLAHPLLLKENLKISIYEVQHVASLGVPFELESFQAWAQYFRKAVKAPEGHSVNLIPLAGRGERFAKEGYTRPKPLIEVNGKPMVIQATSTLPTANENIFVCLEDHLKNYPLRGQIKKYFKKAKIVSLSKVTEGQACTCEIGLEGVSDESSLHISACDNMAIYNEKEYAKLLADESIDVIAWGANHVPLSLLRPESYGWIIKDKNNNISGISVKKPISKDPFEDYVITATFYFRKVEFFRKALASLYKKNKRVNGEFYVDSLIDEAVKLGYKVKLFPVEHFICWGTPSELKSYEYWQSFFHKEKDHPYDIKKDRLTEKRKAKGLIKKATDFKRTWK